MPTTPVQELFFIPYKRGNLYLATELILIYLMDEYADVIAHKQPIARELTFKRLVTLEKGQTAITNDEEFQDLLITPLVQELNNSAPVKKIH